MKKILFNSLLLSILAFGFASCSDDDDNGGYIPEITTTGIYVLNSGQNSNNNSVLSFYNPETGQVTSNIFKNQNDGLILGKTANNMVVYGGKMYILVTGSNKIFITDLKGKLLKYDDGSEAIISPLNSANQPQEPREGLAHGGKVYVTVYDGYVLRIDTTTMKVDKTVKVGNYPEQMTITNNSKMYVANSRTESNTISLVDLNTFTETKKIEVRVNPSNLTSDANGNVYIVSFGNYGDIKSALQKYDPSTDKVTVIGENYATKMQLSKDGKKIYIVNSIYDENWNQTVTLPYYDITNQKYETSSFVTIPVSVDLSKAYTLSVDPVSGDIYVATSDYSTNGDMHIFSADGTYKSSFDTGGINPMGAYFITSEK